jgi:chromosome segregation ATPase
MIVRGNYILLCGVAVVAAARAFVIAPRPLRRVPTPSGTVRARPPDDARIGDGEGRKQRLPRPARTKARLFDDPIARKLQDHEERIRELEGDVKKANEKVVNVQVDMAVLRAEVDRLVEQVDRILDADEHPNELKKDVAGVRTEAREHKNELKKDVADVRREAREHKNELKSDVADSRTAAWKHKMELKSDVADVKIELKKDVADVRTEAREHKMELRKDVADVRTEAREHKNELKSDVADSRTAAWKHKMELAGTIEKAATEIKEQVGLVKDLLSSVEGILRANSKS